MLQTAAIFQSGMILQREKPVAVWGEAAPGEKVTVEVQAKTAETTADENGKWQVTLPALAASERECMSIESGAEKIVFEDVAVGEVWLAGGQSNMEFCMRYEKHKAETVKICANPRVRFYDVPEIAFDGQIDDFDYSRMGIWRKADAENLDYFSAVGYYFQREIEKNLDVPVGIIGCNWGGTTASAWMNPETVEKAGPLWMRMYEEKIAGMDMEAYWQEQHKNPMNDTGNLFNEFSELIMPRTLSDEELKQFFAQMMKRAEEGMAVLADGETADSGTTVGDPMEMYRNMMQPQTIPGSLYEHMVKEAAPYTIRGFLWYQGESDDDQPGTNVLYKDMLTGLIGDWRKLWGEDLPFLFVQLPGYDKWLMVTVENHYPVIRKCQEEVANTVDGAYLCSIADVGEERDIHPKDKKTVGERLSLLARNHVYGEDILSDAPVAKEIKREGKEIEITFANAGNGLYIAEGDMSAMKVLDGERELAFTAKAEGDKLVLTLEEETQNPLTVAFARTSWYLVHLYNEAGIPAVPFEFAEV